jgi:hypothetical protein
LFGALGEAGAGHALAQAAVLKKILFKPPQLLGVDRFSEPENFSRLPGAFHGINVV